MGQSFFPLNTQSTKHEEWKLWPHILRVRVSCSDSTWRFVALECLVANFENRKRQMNLENFPFVGIGGDFSLSIVNVLFCAGSCGASGREASLPCSLSCRAPRQNGQVISVGDSSKSSSLAFPSWLVLRVVAGVRRVTLLSFS